MWVMAALVVGAIDDEDEVVRRADDVVMIELVVDRTREVVVETAVEVVAFTHAAESPATTV